MLGKVIIYMPALNEGETIFEVLNSVPKTFSGFNEVELLVINDGSSDNTKDEALRAGATVVSHRKNKGVGKAFHTALGYALESNADVLVSIDADGQFDVGQITGMVEPILEGKADFCIGNRFYDGKPDKMPAIKFWGNNKISKVVSLIGRGEIWDASCGFRAYSRKSLLHLNLEGSFTYTHETILDLINKECRLEQVPVHVKYFEDRTSRVANNLFSYAGKTSMIIFKCFKDYYPLRFFLTIAAFVAVIALLMGGFVFTHWFLNGTITPYKSLGIFSLALSGMSLLITILGFVADMLNRIRNNQEKILFLLKKSYFDQD